MRAEYREPARDIIQAILGSNKVSTMLGIYNRMQGGSDGRIRTSLSPVGTDTGRFSSKETFLEVSTNLQNIPKKTAKLDKLYDVRTIMVPDEGYALVEGDLSQAELYATAAYAGDWAKIDRMLGGSDEHRRLASIIFSIPEYLIDYQQRQIGKMGNHGCGYGIGWKKFMEQCNKDADITGVSLSAALAKKVVDGWRRANPITVRWWGKIEEQVRRHGFLQNAFGRKHIMVDMSATALNSWIAWLPQSTIADHLNDRLADSFERLDPDPLMVLLQIHDAILGQARRSKVRLAARSLKSLMEKPVEINGREILIPADVATSETSWGEMEKA
jgi:DNA polymerase I-like protein with 3'-5' exonuclease and polymerase domains